MQELWRESQGGTEAAAGVSSSKDASFYTFRAGCPEDQVLVRDPVAVLERDLLPIEVDGDGCRESEVRVCLSAQDARIAWVTSSVLTSAPATS